MARLTDGHSTVFEFSNNPLIQFYHKDTTPPGISGGGPNDITVMENIRWRTRYPKKLVTLMQAGITVQYDPIVYPDILLDLVIQNQLIKTFFPDGSRLDFYGWLDEFKPNAHKEGEAPTADVKIEPSNVDLNLNEIAPVYIAP